MVPKPASYRSKCRIYADILRAIQQTDKAKATYLLHEANLSHERLIRHLEALVDLGLIVKKVDDDGVVYAITTKGSEYLAQFRLVEKFGETFGIRV
ncbi:MAG: winged helix-turn-helix domain-containing protein [Methanomassiliicoccus sp.]|nr:winged helix-turn-helix domain-containing protein [Methanomassiliicoccus sp.]